MSESDPDIEAGRKLFAGPCDFVLGVADLAQLPVSSLPEVAFAGRSNVGKSSLVNALTGRTTLARTSNTPGRTQQLNYFNLGGVLYLVDMPGYGYAKVAKSERRGWDRLVRDYLRGRPTLRCVFLLVDARHGLKDSDLDLMAMLDQAAVAYRIVLTKSDKIKPAALEKLLVQIQEILKKHVAAYPFIAVTSSHALDGIAELRSSIALIAQGK